MREQVKRDGVCSTPSLLYILSALLFRLPVQVQEEADIQQHTHRCGGGSGQTDHGQAGVGLDAHNIRHGQADEQGLEQALRHDENGLVATVEIADHAEQDRGEDDLRCKAIEVGIAGGQVKGLGRGLHQAGNGPCQKHQPHRLRQLLNGLVAGHIGGHQGRHLLCTFYLMMVEIFGLLYFCLGIQTAQKEQQLLSPKLHS